MKQVQRVLSTYSVDLFGVCSALYELGGLIVMHDASGCNSTYNTHDEPRWYDMDSMVYVSGLRETDAILGNDDRLIDDICEAALETNPKFIAVSGSPVTSLMGTDFKGIGRVIEQKTGIPTIAFKTGCMNTYVIGAGQAFRGIVDRFCVAKKTAGAEAAESVREDKYADATETASKAKYADVTETAEKAASTVAAETVKVNIFGVTPLDFSVVGNVEALKKYISDCGFELNCTLAMGDTLDNIANAGNADVTLVVSSTGIPAAKLLKERFGVPYIIGIPIGSAGAEMIRKKIISATAYHENAGQLSFAESLYSLENKDYTESEENTKSTKNTKGTKNTENRNGAVSVERTANEGNEDTWIIGEPVFAASLRYALEESLNLRNVRIICPMEKDGGVLRACDVMTGEEDETGALISGGKTVIADPIYRRILHKDSNAKFIDFPHEAYSGRLYRDKIPVFIGTAADIWLEHCVRTPGD